jgi:hypothetical protein
MRYKKTFHGRWLSARMPKYKHVKVVYWRTAAQQMISAFDGGSGILMTRKREFDFSLLSLFLKFKNRKKEKYKNDLFRIH